MLPRYYLKVNRWQRSWLTIFALTFFFAPGAHAQRLPNVELMTPQAVLPLEGKTGYVLIELDVSGVAPSMEIARRDRKNGRRSRNKKLAVDFSNREKGLFLMQLAPGTYQITQVNAPYYNLPFQKTVDGDVRWRFVVESGKTSYLGLLKIAEERSRTFVNIDLYNRIATSLDDIENQFGPALSAAPLIMGRTVRDDYLNDLNTSGAAP